MPARPPFEDSCDPHLATPVHQDGRHTGVLRPNAAADGEAEESSGWRCSRAAPAERRQQALRYGPARFQGTTRSAGPQASGKPPRAAGKDIVQSHRAPPPSAGSPTSRRRSPGRSGTDASSQERGRILAPGPTLPLTGLVAAWLRQGTKRLRCQQVGPCPPPPLSAIAHHRPDRAPGAGGLRRPGPHPQGPSPGLTSRSAGLTQRRISAAAQWKQSVAASL